MSILNQFLKLHVAIYQRTGGKIGANLAGSPILLLHSIGRKSGKAYILPLTYYQTDNHYVIIGSNNGRDKHPGWYYNLQSEPETAVQVMKQIIQVRARLVEGVERDALWQEVCRKHAQYPQYQAKTSRQIPLFLLERKL